MFFIFNSLIIDNALLALLLSLKSIKQQFLIFINQILKIELYPNPADTFVSIKSEELQGTTKITIYNLLGQIVKKVDFENNSFELDISDIANKGIYFLTFKNNGKSSVKKLIIK